jgi:Domain of unknown function (DUF4340)
MKAKSFVTLLLAAVAAAIAAIATYAAHNQWSPGRIAGEMLLPALASSGVKVAAIEIRQGDKVLILQGSSAGDTWTLKDRAGYPVEIEKVRKLLVRLAQAELIEPKTRKPDRYQLIELEDPSLKDAKSRALRLIDGKGAVIAEIVIGKRRYDAFGSGKGGSYVRKADDPQTWLADREIDPSLNVKDWVKATVFDTDAGKIKRLTLEVSGEEPLTVDRGEGKDAKPKLAAIPEGKKLKDATAADGLVRAASSIELEDVRRLELPSTGNDASLITLETDGGLTVKFRLRKENDSYWLSLTASGDGNGQKLADDVTARTKGWEFKIPTFKAEALLKRRADLFESG